MQRGTQAKDNALGLEDQKKPLIILHIYVKLPNKEMLWGSIFLEDAIDMVRV